MTPAAGISIDVTTDLESLSDLKNLISSNAKAILQLGPALARHAEQPISSVIGVSSPLALALTGSPTWKAGPVSFALTAGASCAITIGDRGETLHVAQTVSDADSTQDIQLPARPEMTYVNIDLDFEISGTVSESGSASGVTISGKASRAATTTLTFCQPVPSGSRTTDALKLAFSQLVFPTSPDSAVRMVEGSSCRMNFDGALNLKFEVSYGLADYKVSAPSATLVLQSLGQVAPATVTIPTAEVRTGVKASVTYAHRDHLGLVVTKPSATTALLYLIRSANNEIGTSIGLGVGIRTEAVSVKADPAQIQQTVQTVTKSATLAAKVRNTVASHAGDLESAALGKLNDVMKAGAGNAELSAALSRQRGRTALFNYKVDLSQATVASASWGALFSGSLADTGNMPGITLQAGSGVGAELEKSTKVQFHFFNLFRAATEANFFDKCSSELAADGSIRLTFDIGIEGVVTTNQAARGVRLHFSASAAQGAAAEIGNPAIDLNMEISEKGDPAAAAILAKILTSLGQPSLESTIDQMDLYARSNRGTLSLVAVLKPSACARLSYSAFTGNKPPQDQSSDRANWTAIQQAAVTLLSRNFLKPWTYADWETYTSICNTGAAGAVADRRKSGNPNAVPPSFWGKFQDQSELAGYFLRVSAEGMNLFEDVATLANSVSGITTDAQWQAVQKRVAAIVKGDFNLDYSKPIAAAVLSRAAQSGSGLSVATAQAADGSSFTATLTLT